MKHFGVFLMMLIMTSGIALAQNEGENCDEAYDIISIPYNDIRNTCYYEDDGFGPSADVFYRLEIEYATDILITLCVGNTDYDSFIWLIADDCATEIAANDDACGLVSEMSFECLAAGVYYIVVEGYWQHCGTYTLDVLPGDSCEEPTIINPISYALKNNYPNPFNPTTTIDFSLAEPQHAVLTVFSVTGQTIAQLVDSDLPAGNHSVVFDASNVKSGLYFYRLEAGDYSATRKMTIVK